MDINLEGIVVIVGNYGSGKTEVSINLAVKKKREGLDVRLADLDLVNPYFRTREARKPLANLGIDIVLPAEKYLQADLPILSPAVAGMIRRPSQLTLIDVGGDDVGATVLASLAEAFSKRPYNMLQIINPLRPFTETVSGCMKIRKEIEAASKMTITGLVGNPNLIDETRPGDIISGYDFVESLSKESGLPLKFIAIMAELLPKIDYNRFRCPILPIHRQLVPPWKKAKKFD
ncbi:MAG: cobalamin biosynthesis protein CbiA [Deltaproteobacteria bacterium]|nr:MAG: cobalamin biosynthesis protein CbiA [Deltaproteobacteria bacterium]